MLHGFVLSELQRILNAGVLRLEIGRLDSSCLDRILNFRFESRDTVARRCEKCEWARVHSDLSRMGRTQVGTVEIRIGVENLRRCAPQNAAGLTPPRVVLVVDEFSIRAPTVLRRASVGGFGVVWH